MDGRPGPGKNFQWNRTELVHAVLPDCLGTLWFLGLPQGSSLNYRLKTTEISSLSEVIRTSFVFSGSEDKVWCDKN